MVPTEACPAQGRVPWEIARAHVAAPAPHRADSAAGRWLRADSSTWVLRPPWAGSVSTGQLLPLLGLRFTLKNH